MDGHYYQLTEDCGSKYIIKELEDAGILEDITDLVKEGAVNGKMVCVCQKGGF